VCFVTPPAELLPVAEAIAATTPGVAALADPYALLSSQPEVMTLENLGQLLQIPVNTLRADLHRRPETMPRRFYLPGRRLVRFLRVDVAAWLLACRSKDGVVDAANRVTSKGTL
jgi:hypothetical protein